MIKIKIADNYFEVKADGSPEEMLAELCVGAECLVEEICAKAPDCFDKTRLKESLILAITHSLLDRL